MTSAQHDNLDLIERGRATADVLPDDLPDQSRFATRMKDLLRHGLLRTVSPFRRFLAQPPAGSFGILMYHRVTPRVPGVSFPTWNVTPRRFRQQLAGLLKRGFQPRHLRELLDLHREGEPIPAKSFVVTFDDGYANNFTHAFPVLRDLGIPATFFLATAYLDSDGPFPSDDWAAAGSKNVPHDSWRPLTTDECRRMLDSELIDLGAHTHTHADFRNKPAELEADLRICLSILRNRFGIETPTFAFPYGTKHLGFSGPVLAAAAEKTGVPCSLTTEDEIVLPDRSPFDWGRFTAEANDTAGTLAVKLSGGFEALRNVWRRFKRTN